jgi:hypothetical protein
LSKGSTSRRSFTISERCRSVERALGADHPDLAYSLVGLAEVALAEQAASLRR